MVEDDNPLSGMIAAIARRDADGHLIAPEQAISAAEAFRLHLHEGGAIAAGDEDNRGSVEPGKWADFVVLTGNPLEGRCPTGSPTSP